jgi:hypothetical protein
MEKNPQYRIGQLRKVDKESRTVEFVISDETRDRHGTVLKADGWQLENYKKNPIVGYMHQVWGGGFFSTPDPDMVIGRGDVFIEDGKLIGRVNFEPADINPLAEKIFKKVQFGSLNTTSVGFMEIGDGYYGEGDEARGMANETYYFSGQELAEWSVVNIPSNPNAVKRSIGDVYANHVNRLKQLTNLEDEDIKKLTLAGLVKILTGDNAPEVTETVEDVESKSMDEIIMARAAMDFKTRTFKK